MILYIPLVLLYVIHCADFQHRFSTAKGATLTSLS